MAKRWYVVQTKQGEEDLAVKQLRKQRFKVFSPVYKTRSKKHPYKPVFSGYIFVCFDIVRNRRWQRINNTRGVYRILGCTEKYCPPVPEGIIERLIDESGTGGVINIEDAVTKMLEFSPGIEYRIKSESYRGLVGSYCNHSENRVTLLLSLLGRRVRVSLPIRAIEPVL